MSKITWRMGKATKFRYLALVVLLAFLGYHSVYFQHLDQRQTTASSGFDADEHARDYLEKQLPAIMAKAIEVNELLLLLEKDKARAFDEHSHALGIGNIRFFLVKGQGRIREIEEDALLIETTADSAGAGSPAGRRLRIATEYVFGNAVRDASGIIRMDQFNTQELNELSASINAIIRDEIIPPVKTAAAPGRLIRFSGAIELNRKHPDLDQPEVIPVDLSYVEK